MNDMIAANQLDCLVTVVDQSFASPSAIVHSTTMTGKLFANVVVFLALFALVAEASKNGDHLKKKADKKLTFSDDDDMLADQPGSGDGLDFTENESIDEIDPDFSVDGSPDVNELLPEGEIDIDFELPTPTVKPAVKPPCQVGTPCHLAKPLPCQTGRPCPVVRPCQSGRRCQSARRPCQSKRTCHSRRPCQSTKRPCQSSILPPAFSPTKVCGQTIYCRKGYRGPCHRNEIFTPLPSVTSRPIHTCPSMVSRPIGCISSPKNPFAIVATPSSPGHCTIRYPQKPCFGYPSTYRYCKRTKLCYPTLSTPPLVSRRTAPGPCAADQFFTAVSPSYGYCRCSRPNYVRCHKTNRCYPAYTKGSCSSGQWMVPQGSHGFSTCKKCPCPSQADGRHIYWNGKQYGRPGCYKSQTRGPCRQGMRFVIGDILTGSARCVPNNFGLRKRPSYESLFKDWDLFFEGMSG